MTSKNSSRQCGILKHNHKYTLPFKEGLSFYQLNLPFATPEYMARGEETL
jgi:hypothetical protein